MRYHLFVMWTIKLYVSVCSGLLDPKDFHAYVLFINGPFVIPQMTMYQNWSGWQNRIACVCWLDSNFSLGNNRPCRKFDGSWWRWMRVNINRLTGFPLHNCAFPDKADGLTINMNWGGVGVVSLTFPEIKGRQRSVARKEDVVCVSRKQEDGVKARFRHLCCHWWKANCVEVDISYDWFPLGREDVMMVLVTSKAYCTCVEEEEMLFQFVCTVAVTIKSIVIV